MDYYEEIKNELVNNEINKRVKNYSINKSDLDTYYKVGKMLSEAGSHYGEGIIREYSKRLSNDLGRGYSKRNLWLMLKFYEFNKKVQTVSAQLTWSHYCELLPLENIEKINYYIGITQLNSLSVRQLREKIKSCEYERLPKNTRIQLLNKSELSVVDFVKNPIMIKNTNNYEVISEKILKRLILENIESFMKELGSSFCFVGSEYKIRIGNTYNYIDLLLYNIEFNCYVVVELKVTELRKEHIGQIQVYMNYLDENLKNIHQDKTIGIIVCRLDNKYLIRYCSDSRIVSRTYELV